jgi:L-asparaginase II
LGLGIALKCDDGAIRGAETMIAAVLAKLLASDEALSATLITQACPVLKNWNGLSVASLRPTAALA